LAKWDGVKPVLAKPDQVTTMRAKAYLYNPGIMNVMPMAGGCLTRKNTQECLAVFL